MTHGKPITVSMAAGGSSRNVTVEPGDTARDVLAKTVDGNPDKFILRTGTGHQFDRNTDLYDAVKGGDALYSATDAVVGTSPGPTSTPQRTRTEAEQ